ncbi:MAG: matrixin family metalloprotease [Nitrospirae bacterium]|nr:matrixin family metalloprotease [Nitrospirota bacterium]
MKKSKGLQLGAMLAAMLLLFVVLASTPASAYSAGPRWQGTSAYYGWDWWGSIPSDWKPAIRNAAATWNSAGSVFRLNEDFWTANVYKASLGVNGPQANTDVSGSGQYITSVTTTFNGDKTWTTTGESNKHDVQDVATHEFGHWLFLYDLYGTGDTEKTMYGVGGPGVTKRRTLEQDDKDGIIYLYG